LNRLVCQPWSFMLCVTTTCGSMCRTECICSSTGPIVSRHAPTPRAARTLLKLDVTRCRPDCENPSVPNVGEPHLLTIASLIDVCCADAGMALLRCCMRTLTRRQTTTRWQTATTSACQTRTEAGQRLIPSSTLLRSCELGPACWRSLRGTAGGGSACTSCTGAGPVLAPRRLQMA